MNNKKCVLFDLDGTLFDSSKGIKECYKKGLVHFGINVTDDHELDKVIGPSLYNSYRDFYGLTGDDVQKAVDIYREHYNEKGIYMIHLYDGIESLLFLLKSYSFTVCLTTSKPQVMAEKILRFSGLDKYFNVVCGARLDGSLSDKADLIQKSLKLCDFTDKENAYMIGDRFYDIVGARQTGIRSIGVTYGFGTREELTEAGADFIADSAKEIADILM